jgi:hypothetical protein
LQFINRFDYVGCASAGEVAPEQERDTGRFASDGRGEEFRAAVAISSAVEPPVGGGDVEPAVAIEITDGDAIPPAGELVEG